MTAPYEHRAKEQKYLIIVTSIFLYGINQPHMLHVAHNKLTSIPWWVAPTIYLGSLVPLGGDKR